MTTVPSTPTATDANADRKIILNEIATLTQERDIMRDSHGLYAQALTAVKKEFAAVTGIEHDVYEAKEIALKSFGAQKQALITEISDQENRRDAAKREADSILQSIESAGSRLATALAQLDDLTEKITERQAQMREEERQHTASILDLQAQRLALQQENDTITADTELKRAETAENTAWILAEEIRLATKARDLVIYEGRIREQGKKLNPDFEMIL